MNEMKNFWATKNVLVTGANGFLASWLVKDLISKGANVIALNFEPNYISVFEVEKLEKKCHVVSGDILDFNLIKKLIIDHDIEIIFHLGAQAICNVALSDPAATLDTNIRGSINILEAVRQINSKIGVIVASSDKAYGTHASLPYEETFSLKGEFPYEVSKSCADLIAQMYFTTYSLAISVVRCGNIYGGGDAHFSRIFPNTIWRLFNSIKPIIQNNSIRDYLYVEDAVRGYILIAENLDSVTAGQCYNIGNKRPTSVKEVIQIITKAMGKNEIEPEYSSKETKEIMKQWLSNSKIMSDIGWNSNVSLEEGVKLTVDWYVKYFDRHPHFDPEDLV